MSPLKSKNTQRKIVPLRRLKPKGGDFTDLRVKKTIGKNGNAGCIFVPVDFMKDLNWTPRETEVYLTLTEKGELLVTPVPAKSAAKAS
jgi:hypothetical protein